MKAINLSNSISSPAPKEWEKIPEIKAQKPSPIGQENTLQRIDGTNICAWYINNGDGLWAPNSDFFLVEPEKNTLEQEDINHLHDVVLEALDLENITDEGIIEIYNKLPEHLKKDAERWGLSDTVVGDSIYVWLKDNVKKIT